MDIGNQQRVIIVETEQITESAEPAMAGIEASLEDLVEEEWPLPVEIDPTPVG